MSLLDAPLLKRYLARNLLNICVELAQAQCQKDLKGLSTKIENKQASLEVAQQELQQQQKTEAAMQKRISEAERRLEVHTLPGIHK